MYAIALETIRDAMREVSRKIVFTLTPLKSSLVSGLLAASPPLRLNPSLRPAIRRNPSPTSSSHGAPGLRLRRWWHRSWRQDPPPPFLPLCRRVSLRAPRPHPGGLRGGGGGGFGFAGWRVVLPDHLRRRLAPPPFLVPEATASTHGSGPASAGAAREAPVARSASRGALGASRRAAFVAAPTVRFVSSASSFACLLLHSSAARTDFIFQLFMM